MAMQAGAPYEMDPETLATRPGHPELGSLVAPGNSPTTTGHAALDRLLGFGKAMTAHPHIIYPGPNSAVSEPTLLTWAWYRYLEPSIALTMVLLIFDRYVVQHLVPHNHCEDNDVRIAVSNGQCPGMSLSVRLDGHAGPLSPADCLPRHTSRLPWSSP